MPRDEDFGQIRAASIFGGSGRFTDLVVGNTIQAPTLTTTQRNALSPAEGMIIFNTTDTKLQVYAGGAWVNLH